MVRDVSDSGVYLSGFSNSFDFETFQTRTNATIWFDSDGLVSENQSSSDYQFMHLPDGNGDPFQGEVLSISDNGFAVGGSADGAFIWHKSFGGVRLFDEWLLSEHGIDLPTNPTSINDVYFDGQNLNFAVQGSAYFVSANITAVPEPSAAALLVFSTMMVCCRRRRKRT